MPFLRGFRPVYSCMMDCWRSLASRAACLPSRTSLGISFHVFGLSAITSWRASSPLYLRLRLPSCYCRHLGSFFIAGQPLITSPWRDPYTCGSLGRDAKVLHLLRWTNSSDGGCSPDRHSNDVNPLLPIIASLLSDAGRRRVPNMPSQSFIPRVLRWGGSKCSRVAAAAGGGSGMVGLLLIEVVTSGFWSPPSWHDRTRILPHLAIQMYFKDGGRFRTTGKLPHIYKWRWSRHGQKCFMSEDGNSDTAAGMIASLQEDPWSKSDMTCCLPYMDSSFMQLVINIFLRDVGTLNISTKFAQSYKLRDSRPGRYWLLLDADGSRDSAYPVRFLQFLISNRLKDTKP